MTSGSSSFCVDLIYKGIKSTQNDEESSLSGNSGAEVPDKLFIIFQSHSFHLLQNVPFLKHYAAAH